MNLVQEIILDKDKVLKYLNNRMQSNNQFPKLENELELENNKIKHLFENLMLKKITREEYDNTLSLHKQKIEQLSKQIEDNKYLKIDLEQLSYNYNEFVKKLDVDNIMKLDKIDFIKRTIKTVFIDFKAEPLKITIKYLFDN